MPRLLSAGRTPPAGFSQLTRKIGGAVIDATVQHQSLAGRELFVAEIAALLLRPLKPRLDPASVVDRKARLTTSADADSVTFHSPTLLSSHRGVDAFFSGRHHPALWV